MKRKYVIVYRAGWGSEIAYPYLSLSLKELKRRLAYIKKFYPERAKTCQVYKLTPAITK